MFRITRRTAPNKVDRRSCIFCHDFQYIEKGGVTYVQTRTMCNRKGRLDNEDTHHLPGCYTVPATSCLVEEYSG